MLSRRARAAVALWALVLPAMVAPGCSCDCNAEPSDASTSGETTIGAGGATGAGGDGAGEPASSSSASSSSGTTGEGGSGGATGYNARATEMVTSGEVARSARYRMVFTFGQPTQNQGKTTSQHFKMRGGLIGAQGSLP